VETVGKTLEEALELLSRVDLNDTFYSCGKNPKLDGI